MADRGVSCFPTPPPYGSDVTGWAVVVPVVVPVEVPVVEAEDDAVVVRVPVGVLLIVLENVVDAVPSGGSMDMPKQSISRVSPGEFDFSFCKCTSSTYGNQSVSAMI